MLAGSRKSSSRRRSASKTCRRFRSASRCWAAKSSSNSRFQTSSTTRSSCRACPSRPSALDSRRSTSVVCRRAIRTCMPVLPPRRAYTSMKPRSRRSPACSTCTCTTSSAWKASRARRARCMAPARWPARCASSRTSPTRPSSRPVTTSRERLSRKATRAVRSKDSSTCPRATTPRCASSPSTTSRAATSTTCRRPCTTTARRAEPGTSRRLPIGRGCGRFITRAPITRTSRLIRIRSMSTTMRWSRSTSTALRATAGAPR